MRSILAEARYVSLATFKRSGDQVATPVWAAPVADCLYVFSAGDAGKVKRLRNGDRARVAVCDYGGKVLGPWVDARAVLIDARTEVLAAHAALRKKYGWQMLMADIGARVSGRFNRRAYIRIELA